MRIVAILLTAIILITNSSTLFAQKRIRKAEIPKSKLFLQRSLRSDIDLVLIPVKYNILETAWLNRRTVSTYHKPALERHLKKFNRSIADLQKISEYEYSETDNVVSLNVAHTSHYAHYDYDARIPLAFYGPTWFKPGVYKDVANQQSIVPTLAKLMGIRNPNGATLKPLTGAFTNSTEEKPEAIVHIVIDQGGRDLLENYKHVSPNIRNLIKESAWYENTAVGHVDVHTAPGHAAIGTGAYPIRNGVIGNTFHYPSEYGVIKKEIYAEADETITNPSELWSETLADVLDYEYDNKAVVISTSYALRAAIGMAGHGSQVFAGSPVRGDRDHVYWLWSKKNGFVTDERFYQLSPVLEKYKPLENFLEKHPEGFGNFAPVTLEDFNKKWHLVMGSPGQVALEANALREVIQTEIVEKNLHADGVPDLIYYGIKATDAVGHEYGWESREAEAVFVEADKQIGEMMKFLKEKYGNKFMVVFTADHGCAPLPEISGGSRYLIEDLIKEVDSLMSNPAPGESLIKYMTVAQLSLNRAAMKKHKVTEAMIKEKIMKITISGKKFFESVESTADYRLK